MQRFNQGKLQQVCGYLWLLFLAFVLVLSTQNAYRQALGTEEFAYACDSFGYLVMAKEIREAASKSELPDFRLESKQTRLIIDYMKSQNVPVPLWDELVAPHAHHYFPRSNHVGVQYPPGTGLALALFPEGKAIYNLNRLVVWTFFLTGLLALIMAGIKRAWASAGLIVLALHLGLEILVRVGGMSFSIAAVLVPILLTCLLSLAALRLRIKQPRLAWFVALLAGLCLGYAMMVRLPVFLLAPGFLILLWPRSWRESIKGLPGAFCLALIVCGVIPVLLNQQHVAGAWYLPTYADVDAAVPTFKTVQKNFPYFFGDGYGSKENWALLYAVAGFMGFVTVVYLRRYEGSNSLGLSWKRLAWAGLAIWTASTLFFITHEITAPYYTAPGTFGAIALLAFGALAIESVSKPSEERAAGFHGRRLTIWLAVLLVILPGIGTLKRAWTNRITTPAPTEAVAHKPITLPPELADERAWVYADLLTGSLWYYARKPAFKIQFSNGETRTRLFRFVFERQEPQYIIQDSEAIKQYMDEIVKLGGALEKRGLVDGQPYFHIRWPESGPGNHHILDNPSGMYR
jgi:hypothetical protein